MKSKISNNLNCRKTKVYISPYSLKEGPSRKGVLLRFDFEGNGLVGHSDFLPWPQYGEQPLKQQLEALKKGYKSERFLMAEKLALEDAKARLHKRNLFYGLKIPPSHYLINRENFFSSLKEALALGYKIIKIKCQRGNLSDIAEKIKKANKLYSYLKWRLDFNGSLKASDWPFIKELLFPFLNQLDFIEDPFSLLESDRIKNQKWFAWDWVPNKSSQIRIIKPLRGDRDFLYPSIKRIIFTHSMDHPLGQVATAFQAGRFYRDYPDYFETCGLKWLSPEKSDFVLHSNRDPVFHPPFGFGFGFQEELNRQKWQFWTNL